MSESYVMCGKDEGEEIEVVRVFCTKCDHFEFKSIEEAAKISDLNFSCPLCSSPEGIVRVVKNYTKCSSCGEVYSLENPVCYCIPENKPMLTWYHKSNERNPISMRHKEQIEDSKIRGLERKIVKTARQKQHDMEVRTDENLQKLVELLLQKEKQ